MELTEVRSYFGFIVPRKKVMVLKTIEDFFKYTSNKRLYDIYPDLDKDQLVAYSVFLAFYTLIALIVICFLLNIFYESILKTICIVALSIAVVIQAGILSENITILQLLKRYKKVTVLIPHLPGLIEVGLNRAEYLKVFLRPFLPKYIVGHTEIPV